MTHRVTALTRSGAFAQLTLKGDANRTVDPEPVTVAHAGRLVWTAPYVGRVAAFSASARGGFVLGCLVDGRRDGRVAAPDVRRLTPRPC